jgi:hypothetical protein
MIKWIVGYIDCYDYVHYQVVKETDKLQTHNQIWPGPKHKKWRWLPEYPKSLNCYGEFLDEEDRYKIWQIIDKNI